MYFGCYGNACGNIEGVEVLSKLLIFTLRYIYICSHQKKINYFSLMMNKHESAQYYSAFGTFNFIIWIFWSNYEIHRDWYRKLFKILLDPFRSKISSSFLLWTFNKNSIFWAHISMEYKFAANMFSKFFQVDNAVFRMCGKNGL